MCSDLQLFALGTSGRTVGQCAGLHITATPQYAVIHRAALHWHSAGNVRTVGKNDDTPHRYIYSDAMSIDQWLTTHFATSLEPTNHYTCQ